MKQILRAVPRAFQGKMVPEIVISDWDETITTEDTILLVAGASYLAKPGFEPNFDYFIKIYTEAYREFKHDFGKSHGARDTIDKEIRFQTGLYNVEMKSVVEIERLGLFKGLSEQHFCQQAEKVKLRPNFVQFLSQLQQSKIPLVILSVNWTSLIMKSVLKLHGFEQSDLLQFVVNELEFVDGICTGKFKKDISIRTGLDKLNMIKTIQKNYNTTCYIGDSTTDLLPMINCDIGIAITNGLVIELLKRLNIPNELLKQQPDSDTRFIYAGDWGEINQRFFHD